MFSLHFNRTVMWFVAFWFSFCASLQAQENCTNCKTTLLQQVGDNWYCPNCQPEKFGAVAINMPEISFRDSLSVLPEFLQVRFLSRVSLGEKEEDLLPEVIKESELYQQQLQQQDQAQAEVGEAEAIATGIRRMGIVERIDTQAQEIEAEVRQEQQAGEKEAKLLSLMLEALKASGAAEAKLEAYHQQVAEAHEPVLSQLVGVSLQPELFMFDAMGLTFLFSTSTQAGFTADNTQQLQAELQQGHNIQVIITLQDQQPVIVGTLIPDPHPVAETPQEQQGAHLLLAQPVFLTFGQIGSAIQAVLQALTREIEEASECAVYFFRRAPAGPLPM